MDQIFWLTYLLDAKATSVFQIEEEYNTTLALQKKAESCLLFSVVPCFKTNGTCLKVSFFIFYRTRTQIIYGQTPKGTGSLPFLRLF
jgi:hypothetical protein